MIQCYNADLSGNLSDFSKQAWQTKPLFTTGFLAQAEISS
jgi:hypothetical protein